MNRTVVALVAVATVGVVSVASYAAGASAPTPVVKACVAKKAGTFHGVKHLAGHTRIITTGSCYGWERSVRWDPRGIPGLPGAAGKPGVPAPTATPTGTPTPNAQETILAVGTATNTPAQKAGGLRLAAGDKISLTAITRNGDLCFGNGDGVAGQLVLNKTAGGGPVTLVSLTDPTSAGTTVISPTGPVTVPAAGTLSLVVQCPARSSFELGVTYTRTPPS